MKLTRVSDITDFSNVGFHFSDGNSKIESISNNGIYPLIGDNSSIFEATPKISFSLGLDGMFQTANRFLNIAQTMPISFFMNDTHSKYLSNDVMSHDTSYVMTTIEALEFMKKYFENSSYFAFEAQHSEYSHEVSDEDLRMTNDSVKSVTGIPQINDAGEILDIDFDNNIGTYSINKRMPQMDESPKVLYEEIKKIRGCIDIYKQLGMRNFNGQQFQDYQMLVQAKNKYIIKLMELTSENLQRGDLQVDGLYDKIAFHEEKLIWRDQSKRLANVQSKVNVVSGKAIGKGVHPNELSMLSVDGVKKANNIEVLEALYQRAKAGKTALSEDIDMVGLLIEYSHIQNNDISQYISTHPDFASKIIEAQHHANQAIEKQRRYEEKSTIKTVKLPSIHNEIGTKSIEDNTREDIDQKEKEK